MIKWIGAPSLPKTNVPVLVAWLGQGGNWCIGFGAYITPHPQEINAEDGPYWAELETPFGESDHINLGRTAADNGFGPEIEHDIVAWAYIDLPTLGAWDTVGNPLVGNPQT